MLTSIQMSARAGAARPLASRNCFKITSPAMIPAIGRPNSARKPAKRTACVPFASSAAPAAQPAAPATPPTPAPASLLAGLRRTLLPPARLRPLAACCLAAAVLALLPSAALAAKKSAVVAADPSAGAGLAALASKALSFVLHLDVHLGEIVASYGTATYAILFAIVFAETGLVVTPFLPGDSLLFATGALAALGKLNALALMATYITAATLGDAVNYAGEWVVVAVLQGWLFLWLGL